MKESDRHGEAAKAAKAAIESSRTGVSWHKPGSPNAKEMRGDCYTADGRVKEGK